MAFLSPFPQPSHHQVQISGHSSVQSSYTFKPRMTHTSISFFKFKKIEQGQLLYPKICPPIFHSRCYPRVSQTLNLAQKLIKQILFLGNQSAIRVLHFSKEFESSRFQINHHVSSKSVKSIFKPHIASLPNQWPR